MPVVLLVLFFIISCGTRKKEINYNPVTSPPPLSEQQNESLSDTSSGLPRVKIDSLNILIMMPYELKENFAINTSDIFYDINASSLPAVHFYEGAMLAVLDLQKSGIFVTIKAIESPSDSLRLMRIERSSMWKDADFIIAQVSPALTPVLARRTIESDKQLILTQTVNPDILHNNTNVLISHASTLTQCRGMSQFLVDKFPESQITIVYRKKKREDYLASVFKEAITEYGPSQKLVEIDATSKEMEAILDKLSYTYNNLVLIVSSDEAFVSPIISKLQGYNEQEIINVAGLPTWQDFESIDFMQFDSLVVYLFENNFINNESKRVLDIKKKFIRMYSSNPSPSGINGYNIIHELGVTVHNSGVIDVAVFAHDGFQENKKFYNFIQTDSLSGYENKAISVLKIKDYQLLKMY